MWFKKHKEGGDMEFCKVFVIFHLVHNTYMSQFVENRLNTVDFYKYSYSYKNSHNILYKYLMKTLYNKNNNIQWICAEICKKNMHSLKLSLNQVY